MKVKTINFKGEKMSIVFEKLRPFINVCPITNKEEQVTLRVEYIPNEKVIDITDFRRVMSKPTNEMIESIAQRIYKMLKECANPSYLCVTVFLIGGKEDLTDWSVTIKSNER